MDMVGLVLELYKEESHIVMGGGYIKPARKAERVQPPAFLFMCVLCAFLF